MRKADVLRIPDYGYFKVDLEAAWKTIHADLPKLHAQIKQLLEGIGQLGLSARVPGMARSYDCLPER